MIERGYYDFGVSRAYYAAFYASTALLLREGLTFSKHSGVIANVQKRFVKTGKLDKEHGKTLNWLFELRTTADYEVTVHIARYEAEKAISAAEDFVEAVKSLILP